MQSYIKIDSQVSLRRRQTSDLCYRPLNSTSRSHRRLGSTLILQKSLSKDPRHEGETTGYILQPAHCLGIIPGQESWLFLSQSATQARKWLPLPTSFSTGKAPRGSVDLLTVKSEPCQDFLEWGGHGGALHLRWFLTKSETYVMSMLWWVTQSN